MLTAFEQFKDADTAIEDVPEQWSIEYILFQLCDGDGTKIKYFEEWTYAQAIKWFLYSRYENFVQREMMKKETSK